MSINSYYANIVTAITWRYMVMVGGLGALYSAAFSPISEIGTGAFFGGLGGLWVGLVSGFYLSGLTWLCQPIRLNKKFVRFCTISVGLLTFIGIGFYLGWYFSNYSMAIMVLRGALIVGFACAWIARGVALTIVSAKQK